MLPPDDTIPSIDKMRERVGDLLKKYDEIFNEEVECINDSPPRKRAKDVETTQFMAFNDKEHIRKIAAKGKLASFTVPQLKEMLKTLGLKTGGKKNELVDRIEECCND